MPIDPRIISEELSVGLEGDEIKRPTLIPKPISITVDGITFIRQKDGRYMSAHGEEYRSPIQALVDLYNSRVPSLN